MQAAAARARRLLALPAASGIPGILSGPIPGRASYAEGVLLYRLNGAPASPSSPQHTRGFSSSCFASRSHCELPHLISINVCSAPCFPVCCSRVCLARHFVKLVVGARSGMSIVRPRISKGSRVRLYFSCSYWKW